MDIESITKARPVPGSLGQRIGGGLASAEPASPFTRLQVLASAVAQLDEMLGRLASTLAGPVPESASEAKPLPGSGGLLGDMDAVIDAMAARVSRSLAAVSRIENRLP